MEWFAVLIPLVTILTLLMFYPHKVVWWELIIPLSASIFLILVSKGIVETTQTRDTEYWGGWITHSEYYEEWNERVPCSHPIYVDMPSGTDANGNTTYTSVYMGDEHPFDVSYHSPKWIVYDSNGIQRKVSSQHFEKLCKHFGNQNFVDLRRSYHTIDGDKYVTTWKGADETLIASTSIHSYENRVQASDSLFNFMEVDPAIYELFEYPPIVNVYQCASILGKGGETKREAQKQLDLLNAKLGKSHQVRAIVLVFSEKPMQAALDQENYWKGGNKNELVICIGVDKQKLVRWSYVFSWTEVEKLKIDARSEVMKQSGKPLDLTKIVEWLKPQVERHWVRKEFSDFSYIRVDPPGWTIALIYILVLLVSIGSSFWVIHNQHEERR